MQAGSLSQVLVMELLSSWGIEGFLHHVNKIEKFYKGRRDNMIAAADKHLNGNFKSIFWFFLNLKFFQKFQACANGTYPRVGFSFGLRHTKSATRGIC